MGSKIGKDVYSHYCTFVKSFSVYLQDATEKNFSKIEKYRDSVGFIESCFDTKREEYNDGTIEELIVNDRDSFSTIVREDLSENWTVDEINGTLFILVVTSQAHKADTITASIAKHMTHHLEL